jgi:hypothetical protein
VIVFVLICCSFSALNITTIGTAKQNSNFEITPNNPRETQAMSSGTYILLEENFTDGNMPPTGDNGNWELQQTNPDQTWYIDSTSPYTKPYCATVHRVSSENLQDEWLITPSIDLSAYPDKTINLTFQWYTCFYATIWKHYVELNISISTDGGVTWTFLWSFDDMDIGIDPFTDWTWYNTIYPNHIPISLSDYAGEKDVKIAFQYYSNTTTAAPQQEFSIDDIRVTSSGGIDPFKCSAGGPYNWYWNMQNQYPLNPGVRFHGNYSGGSILTTQLLWDFGDGNVSVFPYNQNPIHFYSSIGTFNVSLTATDNSTTPHRFYQDYTTVTLFLLPPPGIDIVASPISLGIKANIVNDGEYNATYVNWTMNITWGLLQHEKTVANGTIENIGAGTRATIQSKLYFFGFGLIHIQLTAYPENLQGITMPLKGFKIGPLVLVFPQT